MNTTAVRTDSSGRTAATGTAIAIVSWLFALWACYIFLASLPYKFTQHPDTQHIFGTIGAWMGGIAGAPLGELFASYGPYLVGGVELLTAIVLLAPAALWLVSRLTGRAPARERPFWHAIGGAMAAVVMTGAVFFHLATPLGIEVLHEGESDGGSLFLAAVSILVLGVVLFLINRRAAFG